MCDSGELVGSSQFTAVAVSQRYVYVSFAYRYIRSRLGPDTAPCQTGSKDAWGISSHYLGSGISGSQGSAQGLPHFGVSQGTRTPLPSCSEEKDSALASERRASIGSILWQCPKTATGQRAKKTSLHTPPHRARLYQEVSADRKVFSSLLLHH